MPVVWFESYVGDRIQIPGADDESLCGADDRPTISANSAGSFESHFCNDSHALLAKRADSC
jgi:hypothetical protein